MATETLSVKITANASGFSSAINKMSSDMQGLSTKFEGLNKLGEGFKKVGKNMTLVGAGIVASIGGIVAKGSEWTAQVESTQFLYNNLDKSVQKAIEGNSKNAKAIGLTTQQYKNGATSISTYYKNMGLTAEKTADLSVKSMDLVADLGAVADVPFDEALRDFKSALMGNYEAVDKYGVSLSASSMQNSEFVKSLGKSWNQLSDNEKMMAAYNEITRQSASAQGLAKQEAESFGMKFKYLKEQISETVGQIGSALLPVLEPLVKSLSDTASKIAAWVKENPKLTQAILVFVGVIGVLMATLGPLLMIIGSCITIFAGLATASISLNIGLLPLTGTILAIIAVIGAIIGIGILFCQNLDKIKATVSEVWNNVLSTISDVCNSISSTISTVWNNMINGISNACNSIGQSISDAWNSALEWTINTWNNVSNFISNTWNTICNLVQVGIMLIGEILNAGFQIITLPFQFIWQNCKDFLIEIWDNITTFLTEVWNNISTFCVTIFNNVATFLAGVWDSISSTCMSVWSSIKDFIHGVWESIFAFCKPIWDNITTFLTEVWNNISNACKTVFNAIKNLIQTIWNGIKNTTSNIWNGVKSTVSNIWNGIKGTASNIFNGIKSTVSNVWNGIKSKTTSTWNSIKNAIMTPINAAKDAVQKAIDKMKSAFNFSWSLPKLKLPHVSISGKFSINPPSVPKFGISWYSKGAIFKRPTVMGGMGIGDKHNGIGSNAEAILPINKLPQLLGLDKQNNTGSLNLNIENFNNTREQDIKELVEEIAFYLRRKNIAIGG